MSGLRDRIKALLPSGGFLRNVSVLAGGAALAQGLSILAAPLLSRLYAPEDFGVLGVYASLLAIAGVVASLRYELAIPLPEDDAVAGDVLRLALVTCVLISAVAGLVVLVFGSWLVSVLNAPGLAPYLWLLPLGVLVLGLYQALSYWAIRQKAFGRIARTRLNQGVGSIVVQLGLGLLRFGPLGLLLGHIAGQGTGVGTLATLVVRDEPNTFRALRPQRMLAAAKRYIRFPKYSTAGALLNSSSLNLPIVLLTGGYGAAAAGSYFFAQRLLRTPLSTISNAVSQVYYSEAPRLARNDPSSLLRLFTNTARRLALLAVGPLLVVGLLGPWIFSAVFGEQWTEAGVFARLLVPQLLFQFAFAPISQTFSILESQRLLVVLNATKLALAIGPIIVSSYYGLPVTTAVLTHSLGLAANYLMAYVIGRRLIKQRIHVHARGH